MEKSKKRVVGYWLAAVATFALTMGIIALAPRQAHATELTATPTLTTQATTLQTQSTTAGKVKTSSPYKDVTVKTVGSKAVKTIAWMKGKGAYKGVIKTKKFYPYHNITKGEFVKVVKNLYGAKKTAKAITDATAKTKKTATDKWVKAKLTSLAKTGYGMKIKWGNPTKSRIGRATTANLVYNFAHFDPALMP